MAVWSTVTTSQLEYSRIDSDFYHPSYLAEIGLWRRLQDRVGVSKLSQLISVPVRTGRTPRSRHPKSGEACVLFVKTNTLREGSVNFYNSDSLPARVLGSRDYIPNDAVIITIIGATPEIVGRAGIIRAEDPRCVTNQNVAVVCTNENCDAYYLTAFFQTKLGRDQLWRHSRRTEQVNLNCREVERVLVPKLSDLQQKEIGDLVRDSLKASDQSISLYQQAEHLLVSELGLDKLSFHKFVGYTAQFSEIELSRRSDAEFFHTKYNIFLSAVTNYKNGWAPLMQLTSRILPNFEPKKQLGKLDYIEIGDVCTTNGTYTKNRLKAELLPANAKIRLSGGEVIISQVRPTRGAIAIVEDDLNCATVCSGAFYVYKTNNGYYREIIWLYIRSMKNVFEKYCGGTSYPTIDSRYIGKFPVPLFNEDLAEKVRYLIIQSKDTNRKSLKLLEQAKTSVEQLIEEAVQS
jgi:restriction endonuclease S subunit